MLEGPFLKPRMYLLPSDPLIHELIATIGATQHSYHASNSSRDTTKYELFGPHHWGCYPPQRSLVFYLWRTFLFQRIHH
jgi:hypothetical protein